MTNSLTNDEVKIVYVCHHADFVQTEVFALLSHHFSWITNLRTGVFDQIKKNLFLVHKKRVDDLVILYLQNIQNSNSYTFMHQYTISCSTKTKIYIFVAFPSQGLL